MSRSFLWYSIRCSLRMLWVYLKAGNVKRATTHLVVVAHCLMELKDAS